MNGKQAKVIRKLAKNAAEQKGFPSTDYGVLEFKKNISYIGKNGTTQYAVLTNITVYLKDSARLLYQTLKTKYKTSLRRTDK